MTAQLCATCGNHITAQYMSTSTRRFLCFAASSPIAINVANNIHRGSPIRKHVRGLNPKHITLGASKVP